MKTLLILPPPPFITSIGSRWTKFPLNLGTLAGWIEQTGHQVDIMDLMAGEKESRFDYQDYDLVGFSVTSINYGPAVKMMNRLIKKRQRGSWRGRIVVGGVQAFVNPDGFPDEIDYVVVGEADSIIVDLVEDKAERGLLRPSPPTNLDDVPFPAYHRFNHRLYDLTSFREGVDASPMFLGYTTRGCPYNCHFCSMVRIFGRKWRAMSPGRMVEMIEYQQRRHGIRGMRFYEPEFTINRKRVVDFCELLLKKNINLAWSTDARVDSVDLELLKLMRRAGCRELLFGIESCSQRVLDELFNKQFTVEQVGKAISWGKEAGVKVYASIIVGAGETKAERDETAQAITKFNPDYIGYSVYIGYPCTDTYDKFMREKRFLWVEKSGIGWPKEYVEMVLRYYGIKFFIKGFFYDLGGIFPPAMLLVRAIEWWKNHQVRKRLETKP